MLIVQLFSPLGLMLMCIFDVSSGPLDFTRPFASSELFLRSFSDIKSERRPPPSKSEDALNSPASQEPSLKPLWRRDISHLVTTELIISHHKMGSRSSKGRRNFLAAFLIHSDKGKLALLRPLCVRMSAERVMTWRKRRLR